MVSLYALLCEVAIHYENPMQLVQPVVRRIVSVMSAENIEADAFTDELAINKENAPTVARTIIASLHSLLKPLGAMAAACKYYQVKEAVEQDRIRHLINRFYADWRSRAVKLVSTLHLILGCALPLTRVVLSVNTGEVLLSLLRDFYAVVDQAIKQVSYAGDDCPIQTVTKLTETICNELTPAVYSLIHLVQKPGSKDVHLKRQAKLIPDLIYTIEQYEATLIQVNKKTKGGINLTLSLKRSTARDFRIDGEKLSRRIEKREQSEEDESSKRRKESE